MGPAAGVKLFVSDQTFVNIRYRYDMNGFLILSKPPGITEPTVITWRISASDSYGAER